MQNSEIEFALQPLNESLIHLVHGVSNLSQEKDIICIMKSMAHIRTRALETGWDTECEREMDNIHAIQKRLDKTRE